MWRNVGQATAILIIVALVPLIQIPLLVIAYDYFWGSKAEIRRDRREYAEDYAEEKRLEQAFVQRPVLGNQTFALAEIFPATVTRACVSTYLAVGKDPALVLARRAPRPFWWYDSNTLAVELLDGSARSFRISHHGAVLFGDGRSIRFYRDERRTPLVSLCSSTGSLFFTRLRSSESTVRFSVRAE
jgi:hypothetical protein